MAIVKKLMRNTTGIDLGKTYARNFPVDDNAVTVNGDAGIEFLSLFALKADGVSEHFDGYKDNGGVGATAIKADATDETKPAVGIVVMTSDKNMYGGLNLSPDYRMKPVGVDQEIFGVEPVKEALIRVYDDTAPNTPVYNVDVVTLTGTVEVAGGALDTIAGSGTAFSTEVAVGDLVEVGGMIREVKTIGSDTSITVSEEFSQAVGAGATAKRWHDYDRPVYLAKTAGEFTKIKPVTAGEVKQQVGKIVSGNNVRIEIKNAEIVK